MKIVPNANTEAVVSALAARVLARLNRNIPVLLLVSGGSCEDAAIGTFSAITGSFANERGRLKMLFNLGLVDERFGKTGHQDSNWRQLLDKGLDPARCNAMPIIVDSADEKVGLDEAVSHYDAFLSLAVRKHDEGNLYIACLLGLGDDGHIAGILPESPASQMGEDDERLVTGYRSALFPRVTVTPSFFRSVDYAAVWVSSHTTIPSLDRLSENLPIERHPAQLVKKVAETEIFAGIELPERILKRTYISV
jgi:6-phosphogluconolactonase/glucosamine-6-phosphate isomerase/deaminase